MKIAISEVPQEQMDLSKGSQGITEIPVQHKFAFKQLGDGIAKQETGDLLDLPCE
jgi:hypothetical protein